MLAMHDIDLEIVLTQVPITTPYFLITMNIIITANMITIVLPKFGMESTQLAEISTR